MAILFHPDASPDGVLERTPTLNEVETFKRVSQAHHHLTDVKRREQYDTNLRKSTAPAAPPPRPNAHQPSAFHGKWKTPTFFAEPTGGKRNTSMAAAEAAASSMSTAVQQAGMGPTKQKKAKWSNRVSPYASSLASPAQAAANHDAQVRAGVTSASSLVETPWWNASAAHTPAPVAQAYSFECPGCQTTLQVNLDPNQVGSQKLSIKCPHCQCVNEAVVQAAAPPPAPPAAGPPAPNPHSAAGTAALPTAPNPHSAPPMPAAARGTAATSAAMPIAMPRLPEMLSATEEPPPAGPIADEPLAPLGSSTDYERGLGGLGGGPADEFQYHPADEFHHLSHVSAAPLSLDVPSAQQAMAPPSDGVPLGF